MEQIRYVNAPLAIVFEKLGAHDDEFKREFDKLSSSDDDSVGEWLRLAKAKGDTSESDQILLTLVAELHRKVDELSAYIKGEKVTYIELESKGEIEAIGYEYFKLNENLLEIGQDYYSRIAIPVFPKREVAIYFKAISPNEGKLGLLHERDEKDWNAYVVARERVMIREMKAKKG